MKLHDKHKQHDILTRLCYEVPDLNSAQYSQHSQYLAGLETPFNHAPVDSDTRKQRLEKLRELQKGAELPLNAVCPSSPVLYNSQNYGEMFGLRKDRATTKRWEEWPRTQM